MASVTKGKSEDQASHQDDSVEPQDVNDADEADESEETVIKGQAAKPALKDNSRTKDAGKKSPGFFTIQKHGQGMYTRVGTAIGAAVLGLMLAYTIFDKVKAYYPANLNAAAISALAFIVVYSLTAWYLMNKTSNVEFLIATDSEMKKVNWTSRKELFGSTRVVVFFMLLVATFLFSVDIIWGSLMKAIHVLQFGPFGK